MISSNPTKRFIVMGVCGSGKTTIGKALADKLGIIFFDADDFHPAANREKMSQGIPLDDSDRLPWLSAIGDTISSTPSFVLACSALKESYRSILCQACPDLKIILLHGSPEQLTERLQSRKNHFMPPALLASQLATLEIPTNALTLNIALTPEQMIEKIISQE
jgi:carbohydrate kinase (thermoresistant glucokinase family)